MKSKKTDESNKNVKIHIVGGTGQMGKWCKEFLESHGYEVSVSGKKNKNDQGIQNADIVILSVPIAFGKTVLEEIIPLLKSTAQLIDLSSIMSLNEPVLQNLKRPAAFIHFMFGPKTPTVQNQHIVIHMVKQSQEIEKIIQHIKNDGGQITQMLPSEHDAHMAHTQALIHFANLSLADTLLTGPGLHPQLSTPTFLHQTALILRILTNNSSELLANIQTFNPYFIPLLETYLIKQQKLQKAIQEKDVAFLANTYQTIQQQVTPKKNEETQLKRHTTTLSDCLKSTDHIAYLGPEGTFSHEAAKNIAGNVTTSQVAKETIYDIFSSVAQDTTTIGIVPAENSTEGTIRETLDYLVEFDVQIGCSYELAIHQTLLSHESDLPNITTVASHPQAIAQCRTWIKTHIPQAKIIYTKSTLSEIKEKQPGYAYVGPAVAAEMYHIPILTENIEDNTSNITKFYVLTHKSRNLNVPTTRTMLFLSIFNRVGILRDILGVFASFNINLNKIESRPSSEKVWDYYFFMEVEVQKDDPVLQKALNMLTLFCPEIKILGSL